MSTSIHVDRTYPHPREKVWRALTDADLLARWLMPNDFEPRVGHRFRFTTEPGPGFDGVVHCEVLELVEPETLAFSWKGGPIDTVVRFRLERVAGGTRLLMEQSGFRGVRAWLVGRILDRGCRTLYGERLPALLDALDGDVTDGAPPQRPDTDTDPDDACMSPGQKLIARLLALLPGGRRK